MGCYGVLSTSCFVASMQQKRKENGSVQRKLLKRTNRDINLLPGLFSKRSRENKKLNKWLDKTLQRTLLHWAADLYSLYS